MSKIALSLKNFKTSTKTEGTINKAKKLFLKYTLMMEGISYLVLIPLAAYVVFYHGALLGERLKYLAGGLVIALVSH